MCVAERPANCFGEEEFIIDKPRRKRRRDKENAKGVSVDIRSWERLDMVDYSVRLLLN